MKVTHQSCSKYLQCFNQTSTKYNEEFSFLFCSYADCFVIGNSWKGKDKFYSSRKGNIQESHDNSIELDSLKSELMTLPHPWCSAMTRQYRFIDWFCVDNLYNLIEVLVLGNYVLWNILFFIPQAVLAQWKSFTISIIKLQREWISFQRLFKVACFKFNYNNFNFCYFLLSFWWNIFLVIEMFIIII